MWYSYLHVVNIVGRNLRRIHICIKKWFKKNHRMIDYRNTSRIFQTILISLYTFFSCHILTLVVLSHIFVYTFFVYESKFMIFEYFIWYCHMSGVLWKFYIVCIWLYFTVCNGIKTLFFKVLLHMILKLFNGMLFTIFIFIDTFKQTKFALMKISDHHSFVK